MLLSNVIKNKSWSNFKSVTSFKIDLPPPNRTCQLLPLWRRTRACVPAKRFRSGKPWPTRWPTTHAPLSRTSSSKSELQTLTISKRMTSSWMKPWRQWAQVRIWLLLLLLCRMTSFWMKPWRQWAQVRIWLLLLLLLLPKVDHFHIKNTT